VQGKGTHPRNASIELNLAPTAGGDVSDGGFYSPPFFPQLPYTLPAGGGAANLLFWSVTDGTNGQVLPPAAFNQQVASLPLTITAWYFPISGPGIGGSGVTAIIDDAFSASLGQFIDDTFVNVTSDPTLTNDANVIGIVPTKVAETLTATSPVPSTGEPFYEWILNDGMKAAGDTTLHVPAGTNGIAIAIYQKPANVSISKSNLGQYATWQWVDYGTMVDGGPHPWNPFVNQLMAALAVAGAAKGFEQKIGSKLMEVAMEQVKIAAASIQKAIQSSIR
jgi:hypothetical protein